MALGSPAEPWTSAAYRAALDTGRADEPTLDALVRRLAGLRTAPPSAVEVEADAILDTLAERGIQPRRSRLTQIYVDLHDALADRYQADGALLGHAWHRLLARDASGAVSGRPDLAVAGGHALADLVLRRPSVGAVMARLRDFDPRAVPDLDDVHAHRLAGAILEALALSDRVARASTTSPEGRWQVACCRMHLSADTAPLRALLASADAVTPDRRVIAALYAYAAPRKWAAERADDFVPAGVHASFEVFLRACHDQDVPMHRRLVLAGRGLARIATWGDDVEVPLVLLLGLARWLFQAKRRDLTHLVMVAYEAVSRALSAGLRHDVLGFGGDIAESLRADDARVALPPHEVATSWSSRVRGTAALVGDLVAQLGVSRTRQLFAPSQRARRIRADERRALMLTVVRRVDAMKGPLLKVAQHAGTLGLRLDPAVERHLHATQGQCRPVATSAIRGAVEASLGPIARRFAWFSETPLGVGSVGQVHAARLLDGREVAVKVRFPGIRQAIRHDLWQLGLVAPLAYAMRPKMPWRPLVHALEASLLRECDYRREARMLAAFGRHFADDPVIRIPTPFPEHSSDSVLTMSRAHGASLESFAENAPYAERRAVADATLRLMAALVDGRYTWNDPQPGNYLVADTELHVVDFGCVASWEPETWVQWLRLGRAMIDFDEPALRRGLRQLGFPVDADRFDYKEFVEHFHSDHWPSPVDEAGATLPTAPLVAAQLAHFFSRRSPNFHNLRVPPHLLLALRSYYGTMLLLSQLRTGVAAPGSTFRAALDDTIARAEAWMAVDRPSHVSPP